MVNSIASPNRILNVFIGIQTARSTFRHYLGDIFNGLVDNGFRIERVEERAWTLPDIAATPGSWAHEMAYNVSFAIVARKEV